MVKSAVLAVQYSLCLAVAQPGTQSVTAAAVVCGLHWEKAITITLARAASKLRFRARTVHAPLDNLRSWKLDYIHPPRRRPQRQLQGPLPL